MKASLLGLFLWQMVVLNLVSAGKLCSLHPLNKSFPGYLDIRAPYNGSMFVYALGPFFLVVDLPIAWDQAPDWVKEKKNEDKFGQRSEPSGSLGRGKVFFCCFTPFFCFAFFPHCGALSKANLLPQYLQTIDASILNVNNNCF